MPPAILALIASGVSCLLLILLANQVGWVDRREGVEHRKPRVEPIPLIGGAAIALGVVFASVFSHESVNGGGFSLSHWPWMALGGAFLLGLVDDIAPRGLDARSKFSGQCLVAALFAFAPGAAFAHVGALGAVGLGLLCLIAMNAMNTYDHADGLAGGAATIALLPGAPVFAAATLGYLPFNTLLRRRTKVSDPGVPPRVGAPLAMLGDSGSHLLGVALVAAPGAAWFLAIPALDLLRVAAGRVRRGVPFWCGDRTHLGHRLEGLGFHPTTAAAIAALVVAPPLAAVGLSTEYGMLAVSLLGSATLYFAILVVTEGVEGDPLAGSTEGVFPRRVSRRPIQAASDAGLGDLFPRQGQDGAEGADHGAARGTFPGDDEPGNLPPRGPERQDSSPGLDDGESAGPFAG